MGIRETVLPSCWFERRLRVRFAVPPEERLEFLQRLCTLSEGLPIAAQVEWELTDPDEPNQPAVHATNVLAPTGQPSPTRHEPPHKHMATAESRFIPKSPLSVAVQDPARVDRGG
jgi:hypothetical protein